MIAASDSPTYLSQWHSNVGPVLEDNTSNWMPFPSLLVSVLLLLENKSQVPKKKNAKIITDLYAETYRIVPHRTI